jgi:hypothetical protein
MTAREVKIEMLNKALQIMTGYQSDIVYDFESIDEMKDGESACWSIRETGTHFTTDMRRLEGLRKNTKVTYVINRENGAYTITLSNDTQHKMKRTDLKFIGIDGRCRLVYQDPNGQLWKDITRGSDMPSFYSACNNEFEGEPKMPIEMTYPDFE